MSRGARVAGGVVAAVVGAAGLVLLATNVVLRSDRFRAVLNADPESLVVELQGAASYFPGHLRFDSLTIRSRDSNVELEIVLDRADLRVSLADLLRRRFHATRVRAGRLRFRLRERLGREEGTPARLARYPPIGEATRPKLEPPAASPAGSPDAPWRVVIDDLAVASVEEIWIDAWRWNGTANVAGGFELLPGREARVDPSRLEVSSGELRNGDRKVAGETVGAVWCALPRFSTPAYPGNDVWKIVSGGSTLRGKLRGLAFLSPDVGDPRVSGGTGSVRERITLKDGAGTVRLEVMARELAVRVGSRAVRGSARVELLATDVDFRRGEASLTGTRVVLSRVAVGGAPARPWGAVLSMPSARLLFHDGSIDARLAGRLSDARPVVALMRSGVAKWVVGLLRLEDLAVTGRLEAGPSRLALTSLHLTSGNVSVEGAYRARPGPGQGEFRVRKGILSVRVKVQGG